MDSGTRLALQAIVQGLRSSGAIGQSAMTMIVDELRYAARDAQEQLLCTDGVQIKRLAEDLAAGRRFEGLLGADGFVAPLSYHGSPAR